MGNNDGVPAAKIDYSKSKIAWESFLKKNVATQNHALLQQIIATCDDKKDTVVYVRLKTDGKIELCKKDEKGAIAIDLTDGLSQKEAQAIGFHISTGINKITAQGFRLDSDQDVQKGADVSVIDNEEVVKLDQAIKEFAEAKGWTFEEAQAAYYEDSTQFSRQDLKDQAAKRKTSEQTIYEKSKSQTTKDKFLATIKTELGIDEKNPVYLNLVAYIESEKIDLSTPDGQKKVIAYIMKNASGSLWSEKFQTQVLKLQKAIETKYSGAMDLASIKQWAPSAVAYRAPAKQETPAKAVAKAEKAPQAASPTSPQATQKAEAPKAVSEASNGSELSDVKVKGYNGSIKLLKRLFARNPKLIIRIGDYNIYRSKTSGNFVVSTLATGPIKALSNEKGVKKVLISQIGPDEKENGVWVAYSAIKDIARNIRSIDHDLIKLAEAKRKPSDEYIAKLSKGVQPMLDKAAAEDSVPKIPIKIPTWVTEPDQAPSTAKKTQVSTPKQPAPAANKPLSPESIQVLRNIEQSVRGYANTARRIVGEVVDGAVREAEQRTRATQTTAQHQTSASPKPKSTPAAIPTPVPPKAPKAAPVPVAATAPKPTPSTARPSIAPVIPTPIPIAIKQEAPAANPLDPKQQKAIRVAEKLAKVGKYDTALRLLNNIPEGKRAEQVKDLIMRLKKEEAAEKQSEKAAERKQALEKKKQAAEASILGRKNQRKTETAEIISKAETLISDLEASGKSKTAAIIRDKIDSLQRAIDGDKPGALVKSIHRNLEGTVNKVRIKLDSIAKKEEARAKRLTDQSKGATQHEVRVRDEARDHIVDLQKIERQLPAERKIADVNSTVKTFIQLSAKHFLERYLLKQNPNAFSSSDGYAVHFSVKPGGSIEVISISSKAKTGNAKNLLDGKRAAFKKLIESRLGFSPISSKESIEFKIDFLVKQSLEF